MIQVEAATAVAIRAPQVTMTPRVRWELQGGSLDITTRLDSFPQVSWGFRPYLEGYAAAPIVLRLTNDDGMFSPLGTGSYLGDLRPFDYLGGKVIIDCGITRADGSIEYVPVYTGFVEEFTCEPGAINIDLVDAYTKLQAMQLAETVSIKPKHGHGVSDYTSDLGDATSKVLLAYVPGLTTGDFTPTWTTINELLSELDWICYGTIESGTTVAQAVKIMAASMLGTIVPRADGSYHLATEWPSVFGSSALPRDLWPEVFTTDNATDWRYIIGQDLVATEVIAHYGGSSVAWRVESEEALVGRVTKNVDLPLVKYGRCARLGAFVLYTANKNYPKVLSFTAGPQAMLVEIDDRVNALDPINNVQSTYRVTSKTFQFPATRLECVREAHESSIIEGDFAAWGSTTWGGAAVLL